MELTPAVRTVCHGCRVQTHELFAEIGPRRRNRPIQLPGDGTMSRELSPGDHVSGRCPVCGDTDDPGWLPAFTPPT
ncbi:MAG TPA: hypothetical protein VJ914_08300 [Pseudonocardiaceae bacterium]|nr:hypothetical protein [Pseudonocardiaceae bacterium]